MNGRGACAGWGARCALFVCLAAAVPTDGAAQIVGRVMDRATREGVPDASVLLLTVEGDPIARTLTDSVGGFTFIPVADSATFTLQVVAGGSVGTSEDPIEYRGELARRIVVVDTRDPMERPLSIEGLEVSVEPRDVVLEIFGFYDRKERGYGTFLEPDDFRDAPTRDLTQLIRDLPGVLVLGDREILMQRNYDPPPSGMGRARGLSPAAAPQWRERFCTPSIWVNGSPDWRLNDMIRDGEGFSRMAGMSVNDFLPGRDEIIGIEVYRSRRSVPRDLQIEAERLGGTLSGDCGIIMLWTH